MIKIGLSRFSKKILLCFKVNRSTLCALTAKIMLYTLSLLANSNFHWCKMNEIYITSFIYINKVLYKIDINFEFELIFYLADVIKATKEIRWGLEYTEHILCRQIRLPHKRHVLVMTLNCIWWWGSSSRDLGSMEYFFIPIVSWSTQTC